MLTLPKSAIVNGVNACRADHSRSGAVSVRVSVNLLTDALSPSQPLNLSLWSSANPNHHHHCIDCRAFTCPRVVPQIARTRGSIVAPVTYLSLYSWRERTVVGEKR